MTKKFKVELEIEVEYDDFKSYDLPETFSCSIYNNQAILNATNGKITDFDFRGEVDEI